MSKYPSNVYRSRYVKHWLERFERVNGQLQGIAISKDGSKKSVAPDAICGIHLPPHASRSVNFHTNSGDWKVEDSSRYLEACGYPADAPDGHDVFSVRAAGREMLIPALAVIKALFKRHPSYYHHLFHPAGLEMLCSPVELDGNKTIQLSRGIALNGAPANMFELLRWMYYYPSARSTWNSVYRAAATGRCSIALPKANLRIAVTGEPKGHIILANLLTVGNIEAMEAPYEWAGDQPRFLERKFGKGKLENELVR